MKFSYSININSSPETIFHWIGQPEKAMQWMTSVSKTEMLNETPNLVGSTFRETVSEGGQGIEMHGQVTGYEPNKFIAFHLESKVNSVDVTYRIEQNGGSRLTQDANIRWKFPVHIIGLFAGNKIRQSLLSQTSEEFARLKELCEEIR
jgi:uncharacterized protein YndB with AHSA1/START domain